MPVKAEDKPQVLLVGAGWRMLDSASRAVEHIHVHASIGGRLVVVVIEAVFYKTLKLWVDRLDIRWVARIATKRGGLLLWLICGRLGRHLPLRRSRGPGTLGALEVFGNGWFFSEFSLRYATLTFIRLGNLL